PLFLRDLKGDQFIFDSWSQSLASYPAMQAQSITLSSGASFNPPILAQNIDVSDPLFNQLNGYMDSWQSMYASMYKLSAGVGNVEQDVDQVLHAYLLDPIENII